jgi:hypothetical protein
MTWDVAHRAHGANQSMPATVEAPTTGPAAEPLHGEIPDDHLAFYVRPGTAKTGLTAAGHSRAFELRF